MGREVWGLTFVASQLQNRKKIPMALIPNGELPDGVLENTEAFHESAALVSFSRWSIFQSPTSAMNGQ